MHPPNKQQVCLRLARLALTNDYGQKLVASGPFYKKAILSDKAMDIEFDFTGTG